jgi:hypothetical protein
MCLTCYKYHCHVSLVIKCVIGGLLVTNLNKVWWGVGKKVVSADNLAKIQQKNLKSFWYLVTLIIHAFQEFLFCTVNV